MTPSATRTPVVAIMCDRIELHGHAAHAAFDGYVRAVTQAVGGLPLLVPAAGTALDLQALIDSVDGLLLTGSPSNVEPSCYAGPETPPDLLVDPQRDATTLAQIPQLVDAGLPLLGICRGLQEMNVAYGGSLHLAVHDQPGHLDHREGPHERPIPDWYADSHAVRLVPGGRLARLLQRDQLQVNSLHHQGVQRLGRGLRVEAQAPDGLVEAFAVEAAPQFTLAVQWHPEMRIDDSAEARALFAAFGEACRARRQQRLGART